MTDPKFLETVTRSATRALLLRDPKRMQRTLVEQLSLQFHAQQQAFIGCPTRFRVAACGRRAGKTYMAAYLAAYAAMQGQRVWWVAPTYEISQIGLRNVKSLTDKTGGTLLRSRRLIETPAGGTIQFKSAERADNLRGEGLDLVVLDECAMLSPEVWFEMLRPALIDRGGGALFLSTPKGLNFFFDLFRLGEDPQQPEWASFSFPTAANPFLKDIDSEIAYARSHMPERLFRQELLAEFVTDAGGVFGAVQDHAILQPAGAVPGGRYVVGIDLARLEDYTAVSVLRVDTAPAQQVWVERFNKAGWQVQIARIAAILARYKPSHVKVDQTGLGDVVVNLARADWDRATGGQAILEGVVFTNERKAMLIEKLAVALEQDRLRLLDDQIQKSELLRFEMTRLAGGRFRYSAPAGQHDDLVIALALAADCLPFSTAQFWVELW